MRFLVLITAALAVTACQVPGAAPTDSCGAAARQSLVGSSVSVLATLDLPPPVRVIGPNTIVTLDFREDRLNIYTDNANRIIRVACG